AIVRGFRYNAAVPIYALFSHRNRERPEELIYDQLPIVLRAASRRVIGEALGNSDTNDVADMVLDREHPRPSFKPSERARYLWPDFILRGDFFEAIDAIEMGTPTINRPMREMDSTRRSIYR